METVNYGEKSVVIATHVFATGPAQDLRDYLLQKKIHKLLFIGHPLFCDKRLLGSGYEVYDSGTIKISKHTKLLKCFPPALVYIEHFLKNILYVCKQKKRFDLYVGSNNLNALSGIILKVFGRVKKTVYYVIDYNPTRFKNPIINKIYHWVDQLCVRFSDETWNLSPRMEEARRTYFRFSGGRQYVVPLGVWYERIKFQSKGSTRKNHTVVFMGHITEKQGLQHFIKQIPEIVRSVPDLELVVMGDGDYKPALMSLVSSLGIEKRVTFEGYIEDPKKLESELAKYSVGIALYDYRDENGNLSFTYFADPGKLKLYISCGLLVLTTDISYNVKDLSEMGLVRVVDKESLVEVITPDLFNMKTSKYWKEREAYCISINWSTIFKLNLGRVFSRT